MTSPAPTSTPGTSAGATSAEGTSQAAATSAGAAEASEPPYAAGPAGPAADTDMLGHVPRRLVPHQDARPALCRHPDSGMHRHRTGAGAAPPALWVPYNADPL
ncbi:hypothetical protein GCM10018787_40290 [Streptomyces thermodiastaticus]|nr:hypothetical protein GCM10018787_40290 [Streptomyces thermodiastaticus]